MLIKWRDIRGIAINHEWKLLLQPAKSKFQILLRLFGRHPRLEPRHCPAEESKADFPITLRRIESQGEPYVRRYFIELEAGLHDPDHGMTHAVKLDGLPEYPLIAAEAPLPQTVAQNYDPLAMRTLCFPGGLRHVLFLREEATQRGPDSEHREEIGGDQMDVNLLSRSLAAERSRIPWSEHGHLFKDVIVLLPFMENVGRNSIALDAGLEIVPLDGNQPLRIAVRERSKRHGVDDAEDGAGRTNPQRQAQRDDGCKHGAAAQHPQAVSKIFPES